MQAKLNIQVVKIDCSEIKPPIKQKDKTSYPLVVTMEISSYMKVAAKVSASRACGGTGGSTGASDPIKS